MPAEQAARAARSAIVRIRPLHSIMEGLGWLLAAVTAVVADIEACLSFGSTTVLLVYHQEKYIPGRA